MSDSASHPVDFTSTKLTEFLQLISEPIPAPAAGSGIAVTIALAAGLVAKAARLSRRQMSTAQDLASRAVELRDLATQLCQADAAAFGAVIDARRQHKVLPNAETDAQLVTALDLATNIPRNLAEIATEICELALLLADNGNPQLRGDALSAALLAEAGGQAAMALVSINAELTDRDPERRIPKRLETVLQTRLANLRTILAQSTRE